MAARKDQNLEKQVRLIPEWAERITEMDADILERLPDFLDVLGLTEAPMGMYYAAEPPAEGLTPKPTDLPTLEKEARNVIDWQAVFGNFSCAMGHIWRARKKKTAAYFSAERFGCPGAAFWLGFNKPQVETIVNYVSSGIPGWTSGENYCGSADDLRRVFADIDPVPAPQAHCIVKPLPLFQEQETPALVVFFCRPESLSGLHQMAFFVTNDPEVVSSPWSAACGSIAVWPLRHLAEGRQRAVVGGWDPSARKFFKTDELSFTVPFEMFTRMLDQYPASFLAGETWGLVRKKIARSRRAWGESQP